MKKFYFLSLMLMFTLATFAQTFYSENFGVGAGQTGVDVYTGYQNVTAPIVYTGTAQIRSTQASTGYSGASGAGTVFFTNTAGRTFEVAGINTSAYSTANLVLSFGLRQDNSNANAPAVPASSLTVEVSSDGNTYTPLAYDRTVNTAWEVISIGNSTIPSTSNLRIRFTQTGANAQYRVDDLKVSSVSATCTLALGIATTACNASTLGTDTFNITIPYTGGGNATYSITATSGTIGGANPTTTAAGDIVISNVNEGTNVTINVTGGTCALSTEVVGISCKPINTLPYYENFDYQAGALLAIQQKWAGVNSGDAVIIAPGNLTYTGITPSGNSASFAGGGAEAYTPFEAVTAGKVYASFLMNVTDMSGITTDLTEAYFAGLMSGTSTSSYNARLWTQKNGTQYKMGLSFGNSTTNYTSASYNVGDVVLVILEFDYDTNVVKAWINPTVATFNPTSTAATLTETLTTAPASFGGFILRQDSDSATPAITVDELRIGTAVNQILSTKSVDAISGLTIYPNPVTGGVLNITSNSNADKTVAVFDVLGKQVLNAKVTEGTVNVSGLTIGIYIVKITEEGKTATRKLVVK